jgi:hypothetical protein
MTFRPKRPSQTDFAPGCNGPSSQLRRCGAGDSSCGVAATLDINEREIGDGAVSLDRPDDAVGWGAVVGVGVGLWSVSIEDSYHG